MPRFTTVRETSPALSWHHPPAHHFSGPSQISAVALVFAPQRRPVVSNLGGWNNPDRNIAQEQTGRRQIARGFQGRAQSLSRHALLGRFAVVHQRSERLWSKRRGW